MSTTDSIHSNKMLQNDEIYHKLPSGNFELIVIAKPEAVSNHNISLSTAASLEETK